LPIVEVGHARIVGRTPQRSDDPPMDLLSRLQDLFRRTLADWRWDLTLIACSVVTVGILAVSEFGYSRLETEHERALTGVRVYAKLGRLGRRLSDSETAERGYLLTRTESYLAPYRRALPEIGEISRQLVEHYNSAGDAAGATRMRTIEAETGRMLADMDSAVVLGREGKWQAAVDLVTTHAGQARMDQIREEIEHLQEAENSRVAENVKEWKAHTQVVRVVVAAVTGVNIVLLVLLVRWLRRHWYQSQQRGVALDVLVQARTAQLAMLASHLQEINESEKSHLARELHDELGAILTASRMDISWVRGKLLPDQTTLADKLSRALRHIDQGVQAKRRIIEGLRPTTLTTFGFATAARELVAQAADQSGWQVEFDVPEHDPVLREETTIALFRILQESVNNAAKYSKTKCLRVHLEVLPGDHCTLEIEDRGIGFDAGDVRPRAHGILGMRERVAARGGTLVVDSEPGRGTRITATIPLAERPSDSPARPQ
jgi:signal transduction histidine kinase